MIKLVDLLKEVKPGNPSNKFKAGDTVSYNGRKYKIERITDLLAHLELKNPEDITDQEKISGDEGRISVNPKYLKPVIRVSGASVKEVDGEQDPVISDGVNDPGILKAIFLAGGPGSGKSFVVKDLFGTGGFGKISPKGLKHVSSDVAFEIQLRKMDINPKDLARIEKEDPELFNKLTGEIGSVRSRSKDIVSAQKSLYKSGRLGLIIDGTGDEVIGINRKKRELEELGYDCYMVFVNTSLEVALERNSKRDRRLPDGLVRSIWKKCQENLGSFQSMFGNNFAIVDNTKIGPVSDDVRKRVDQFLSQPVKNPIGKQWIKDEKSKIKNDQA